MAGPTIRAPLNIEEFSAIAFIKSSLPTMSTRNAWRAGMSNALTTPSRADSTKMCHTCTLSVSVSPARINARRSEEHTSELQSQFHLVCRLLLEKKKQLYQFKKHA